MCSSCADSLVCDDPRFQVGRLGSLTNQEQLPLSVYRLRSGFVVGVWSERSQLIGEEGVGLDV